MSEVFDPYRKWLGIPPKDQPPNHYRLLGIAHFEDDPDVIENAASRQMVHVRTFQSGKHSAVSQRILNELTAAKLCLLQPEKKAAYDAGLRQHLAAIGRLSSDSVLAPPVATPEEAGYEPPAPDGYRGETFPAPTFPVESFPTESYPPDSYQSEYPSDKRWRTGTDIEPTLPSHGPVPVPIPMPVTAGTPVSKPSAAEPLVRRTPSRGRQANSGTPIMLILGGGGVVAIVIILGVFLALQPPEKPKEPPKHKPHVTDKSAERNSKASFAGAGNKTQPGPLQPAGSAPAAGSYGEPQGELQRAREALANRLDTDFTWHVSQAKYLIAQKRPYKAEAMRREAEHLQEVNQLLSQFWQAVRDGADKKIPKGERFKFRKQEYELVKREGEQLTYRLDGREEATSIRTLPARVAIAIAYRALGNDSLNGKIAMIMFLTIDADAVTDNANRRMAGKLLDDLQKTGSANHPILRQELGSEPLPKPLPEDDFSPPVTVKPAPASSTPMNNSPVRATSTETPKANVALVSFDAAKLKEAREEFDRRFRERIVETIDKPNLTERLYQDLLAAVEGAATNEFKVQILTKAGELAAALGDSNGIVKVSDQLSKLNGENVLELQNRLLSRCQLEGESAAKDLLKHAKAASAAAQKEGNLSVAIELVKTARKAVDKLSIPSEAFELDNRLEELQALQEKARRQGN